MKHICAFTALLFPLTAAAQSTSLETYLDSMNFAPIQISGKIGYTSDRDREFLLESENGDYFTVRIDAGREARNRVMDECSIGSSIFIDSDKMCALTADGTIEIDGARISVSISEIKSLAK